MVKHLLAIVVVMLIWGCETRQSRLESFLLKGNEEVINGNKEKGLYYFNEALKLDSCFADALSRSALLYVDAHMYADGIKNFSKAIECEPGRLSLWNGRAFSYYQSGDYYNSLNDADQAIKLAPDSAMAYFARGMALSKLAKHEDAIAAFGQALQHGFPSELECRINIATSKISLKKLDEAKAELDACLKIDDKHPLIYNSLALIDVEKNEFNAALMEVNKAIELDSRHPYFINNRGFIEIQLGKLEEAEEDINQSIVMDPSNSWAYRNKGLLELKKKNFDEAERLLKKAKGMDPNTERVDEYLSQIPKKK
ncbi:MAG: tetratricopeptide repeat protein [Bacteroidota bacterium]